MSCFVLNIHYLCGYRNSLLFTIKLFNMRKITLLLSLLVCNLISFSQILNDNFDDLTAGTFGNSGSAVSSTTGVNTSDTRAGWDLANSSKVYYGAGTLKLGTSSALGYIKTSTLNLNGSFTLSFKAYAWSGDLTTFDVKLNDNVLQTVTIGNSTISDKSGMQTFQITGTGTGTDVITFTAKVAAKNRFLLDDVLITSGASAALPTFSVAGGLLTSTQTVAITTETAGATIYYTTDGSTPTTSSTVYSTPISVSSAVTIKAIAVASGLNNSAVASVNYNFPINVATLAELQTYMSATSGALTTDYYKYTGTATVSFSFVNSLIQSIYMQDATGGMLVYDSNKKLATTYNIGDNVTGFIGQVQNYGAAPELIPVSDCTVSSTGNSITPVTATLATVGDHLFKLVKISDVTFSAADGTATFAAVTNYTITDASGSSVIRIPTATTPLNYVGQVIPATTTSLTAIVSKYNTLQLIPRSKSDITALSTGTGFNKQDNVRFVVVGNVLNTIDITEGSSIEIYSALGSKVKSAVVENSKVDISNLSKGLYIVRSNNLSQKFIIR